MSDAMRSHAPASAAEAAEHSARDAALSPEAAAPPIAVSARAIEMGRAKLADVEGDGYVGIRVGVKGGGCSGLIYAFEFAKAVRPERDLIMDFPGFRLLVDRRSLKYLAGSTLQWNDGLVAYGFRWENPNARKDCGCGTSFTAV